MRKGYKFILGVLTIMILITITVGTSYSYYSVSSTQTTANSLATTCFNITYNDDNGSSTIQLNSAGKYAYPMSETNALNKLTPYTFTISNTCAKDKGYLSVNYVITLNTLTASPSTLTSSLNYKLNRTAPTAVTGATGSFGSSNTYTLNSSTKTSEGVDTSYSLETGTLAPGESKTYNLYLWISDVDVNCTVNTDGTTTCNKDIMGQSFTGKVLVYAYM